MNLFKKIKKGNGFTLVELMVAISIYIIMSVLLLASQDKFNSGISFSNLGYDIALTMRQAQTYGYAVRAGGTNNPFVNAYGLHFAANNPNSFTLFFEPIQATSNGTLPASNLPLSYNDCTSQSCGLQVISNYDLQNGYQISRLCYATPASPNNDCGKNVTTPQNCTTIDPASGSSLGDTSNFLDIIFQRPNTTAFMYNAANSGDLLTEGDVELTSPTGDKECVSVFQSGDIEVGSVTAAAPAS